MDREILVWVARVTWFLDDFLLALIGVTFVLLLIGAALFIDWVIEERRKG